MPTLKVTGQRCEECGHPVKDHRYIDRGYVGSSFVGHENTCGCGCTALIPEGGEQGDEGKDERRGWARPT